MIVVLAADRQRDDINDQDQIVGHLQVDINDQGLTADHLQVDINDQDLTVDLQQDDINDLNLINHKEGDLEGSVNPIINNQKKTLHASFFK